MRPSLARHLPLLLTVFMPFLLSTCKIVSKNDLSGSRPNIIFILADDLGWADLPVYGNLFNEAPNLSRMAREGMQFIKVPAPGQPMFLRLLLFNYLSRGRIKKKRPDVVNSFELLTAQDVYRASGGCARRWNKKLEELNPGIMGKLKVYSRLYRLVEQYIEKRAFRQGHYRKIIAISNKVKSEIMEYYGVPSGDIEVIYNGVDLEEFKPGNKASFRARTRKKYGVEDSEFLLLFVGSGFERKGLDALLRAVAQLNGDVLM